MAKHDKQYEAMFLFPTAASADVDAAVSRARSIIESHQGQIIVAKKWDERKLAYEIEGNKRGLYVICYYRAPNTTNAQITRDVNLADDILRVLIVDAEHLSEAEMNKVEPQQQERRPERTDRGFERGGDDRGPRRDRGDRPERSGDRGGDRGERGERPERRDREPAGA